MSSEKISSVSRYAGMVWVIRPPRRSEDSNTITSYPRWPSTHAFMSPAGPPPMTATFIPFVGTAGS